MLLLYGMRRNNLSYGHFPCKFLGKPTNFLSEETSGYAITQVKSLPFWGFAMMAEWSNALLWIASCLSPLPGSNHDRSMWKGCQWSGISLWFSPVTPLSSTTYNRIVTIKPKYGSRRNKNQNFKFYYYWNEIKWDDMLYTFSYFPLSL